MVLVPLVELVVLVLVPPGADGAVVRAVVPLVEVVAPFVPGTGGLPPLPGRGGVLPLTGLVLGLVLF